MSKLPQLFFLQPYNKSYDYVVGHKAFSSISKIEKEKRKNKSMFVVFSIFYHLRWLENEQNGVNIKPQ